MADDDRKADRRKITTDDRGRSVWADTVTTAKFELISTQELRAILDSGDADSQRAIADAAKGDDDGVLVRDAETGMFQVIDDTSLRELLNDDRILPEKAFAADEILEPLADTDDELSLVSTQALRKILKSEPGGGDEPELEVEDPGGGFDPYNSS